MLRPRDDPLEAARVRLVAETGAGEAGRRLLDEVRGVALGANDLSDVGLSAAESAELNRLLLKVIHATDGARPEEGDPLWG